MVILLLLLLLHQNYRRTDAARQHWRTIYLRFQMLDDGVTSLEVTPEHLYLLRAPLNCSLRDTAKFSKGGKLAHWRSKSKQHSHNSGCKGNAYSLTHMRASNMQ